jgi:hypothetical protein
MRSLLAVALAKHAGQVLTPEVARTIMADALLEGDRSISPRQFGQKKLGEYTLQAERIRGLEAELEPIHIGYHKEVRLTDDASDFGLAVLRERERTGELVMFTARTYAGQLIGVARLAVRLDLATQKLCAVDDLLYVVPEFRTGALAVALWRFAEEKMFHFGVREATFTTLTIRGAERLAFALGYTKTAEVFTKSAQEASDYQERRRRPKGAPHEPLAPHRI